VITHLSMHLDEPKLSNSNIHQSSLTAVSMNCAHIPATSGIGFRLQRHNYPPLPPSVSVRSVSQLLSLQTDQLLMAMPDLNSLNDKGEGPCCASNTNCQRRKPSVG